MEFALKKKTPKVSDTGNQNDQSNELHLNAIDDLSIQEKPEKSFAFATTNEVQQVEILDPEPEAEWVEFFTEETPKRAYYHNEITGETVWEKPEGVLIEWDHENAPLPEDWKECWTEDEAKTVYYYNTVSGESVWEKPLRTFSNRKSIRKIRPKSTITGANGAVLHMGISKALKSEIYARRASTETVEVSAIDKPVDVSAPAAAEPTRRPSFMPSSLLKQISRRGSTGVEDAAATASPALNVSTESAATTTTGVVEAPVTPTKTSSFLPKGLLKQLVTPRRGSQATSEVPTIPEETSSTEVPTESVVFIPHEKPSVPLLGWLEKKSHGGFSSAWEKRYLRVLEETGSLIYSKTDNMAGGPSSWIDLKTVAEVTIYELNGKPDPTRFTLEAPDHVYKFKASSEIEAKLWVDGLNAWRLYLSEKGGRVMPPLVCKDVLTSRGRLTSFEE